MSYCITQAEPRHVELVGLLEEVAVRPVFFFMINRSVRRDGRRTLGATTPYASLNRRRTDSSGKPRKRRVVLVDVEAELEPWPDDDEDEFSN